MPDVGQTRDPLDLVAEDFAERLRAGQQPSVDEYTRRFPQLADQLRELLPSVAMMEQLKRSKTPAKPLATPRKLARLGDYRILRELGRGGMGIVYEAQQESLGRRVAVKVLPQNALLDPTKLERFTREAQAAAALHHTNIVPVFGVGDAEGLHYYVMQLIEGEGLDRVISRLRDGEVNVDTRGPGGPTLPGAKPTISAAVETPADQPLAFLAADTRILPRGTTRGQIKHAKAKVASAPSAGDARFCETSLYTPSYWRAIARIGLQVAEALEYAHAQGTLHRDIKPANLLVDEHHTVWVTDFGLAKLATQSDLTATGHIVGTLQYMAPECLKGEADARSDVYSLGLSLYELATLTPPFSGSNPVQTFKQISESSPPAAQINPLVPRDLETIILKATAHESRHRYASAGALAADLERFIEDRPVAARRTAVVERAWRWCRRNPVLAAWTTTALVALVLAGVIGWIGYAQTNAALARESEKKREADTATKLAEANVDLSLAAFEEIFNKLATHAERPPFGLDQPNRPLPPPEESEQAEADAALLQSIVNFYERFAQRNTTNPALQLEAAKAYRHIGDIQHHLGSSEASQAAYHRASETLARLQTQFPKELQYTVEQARTCLLLEPAAGETELREKLIQQLLELQPNDAPLAIDQELLAHLRSKLAWELDQAGKADEAEVAYRRAVGQWMSIDHAARGPKPGIELSTTRHCLAKLLITQSRLVDAKQLVEQAIDDADPGPPGGRDGDGPPRRRIDNLMASEFTTLAQILAKLGDTIGAVKAKEDAQNFQRRGQRPRPERAPGRGRPGEGPPRDDVDDPEGFGPDGPNGRGPEGRGPEGRGPEGRGPGGPRERGPGGGPRDRGPRDGGPPNDDGPPADDDGPPPRPQLRPGRGSPA